MNTWKKTTLGEVVAIIDGDRGVNYPKNHEFVNDGYCLFLNAKNVPNDSFSFNEKMFITQEKDSILGKGKLKRGDFVLTTRGTVGNFAFYSEKVPFDNIRINSGMVILRAKDKVIDKGFLKFYLKSHFFTDQVLFLSSGSAQPQLPIRDLCVFEIQIPPLPEQKAIAAVLLSFDDKIELLRRQNKTLEAIAQAIFKEWFVKFKVKGEQLKLNPKTGLPEGWKLGRIKDCGEIVCGKTPPKAINEYFGGSIPFIKIPDMHNEMFIVKTEDSLTEEGSDFQRNKFIPANSVCVSCIATVGLVSITSQKSQTNQQINTIIPNSDEYLEYLYFVLKNMTNDLIAIGSGGSATLNINTGVFSDIEIVLPSDDILKSYHSTVEPLFVKVLSNMIQIQTLSKLRDTLLPKLMKGEIRVKL